MEMILPRRTAFVPTASKISKSPFCNLTRRALMELITYVLDARLLFMIRRTAIHYHSQRLELHSRPGPDYRMQS